MCESPALAEVDRLRAALETSERERASERTGRIRAEQALRVARAAVRLVYPPHVRLTHCDCCSWAPGRVCGLCG